MMATLPNECAIELVNEMRDEPLDADDWVEARPVGRAAWIWWHVGVPVAVGTGTTAEAHAVSDSWIRSLELTGGHCPLCRPPEAGA